MDFNAVYRIVAELKGISIEEAAVEIDNFWNNITNKTKSKDGIMEEHYNLYLFNCYVQGDIWNETYRPYTYTEWAELNCPENGGIKLNEEKL